MKRFYLIPAFVGIATGLALGFIGPAGARDHGQMGEAWPVIEPDLLSVMKARLEKAQASGEMDDLNAQFAAKVKAKVMRPVPVAGIGHASQGRSWMFDPTVTIEEEIRDDKGKVIAPAGYSVNPLATMTLSKQMVFIDGDRPAEVAWAMKQGGDTKSRIIMVRGSPFDLMKAEQRRFYFDQKGTLTAKFGIRNTPASVRQEGTMLRVQEIVLKEGS